MSAHNPPLPAVTDPFEGLDFAELEMSLRRPRTLMSALLSGLVTVMTLVALVPLFSVIFMLVWRGGHRLSLHLFTQLPPAALEQGGGFGNAIVGTLIIIALATLITVPIGILCAVFLAQAKPESRLAQAVRFAAKVLTGFPSILAGVFAYGAIVLLTGGYSAIAGAIAVSILMLPTILLTAEDAIRMVPVKMQEAAMLAIARGAGETAPLLFTALFSNYWPITNGQLHLMQPTASLAVLIYNFAGMPFDNQVELAWAAALVLVLLVLVTNLTGQALGRRQVR
jgi:phosphate transport system permease protein